MWWHEGRGNHYPLAPLCHPRPYFGPVAARDHHIWRTERPGCGGDLPLRAENCPRWVAKGLRQASQDRGHAMRIRRQFTVEGHSPYEGIAFRNAASEIRNPDGSIVFAQDGIEVPEGWSQVASDVLAQKYFRKAGVPKSLKAVAEEGVPEFLWRKQASGKETTGEKSAKQV